MSFDYDEAKEQQDTGEKSLGVLGDLFAAMAFVFLFLYVLVVLQNNVLGVVSEVEKKKLEEKYAEEFDRIKKLYQAQIDSMELQSIEDITSQKNIKDSALYKQVVEKAQKIKDTQNEEIKKRLENIAKEQRMLEDAQKEVQKISSLEGMIAQLIRADLAKTKKFKQAGTKFKEEVNEEADQKVKEIKTLAKKVIKRTKKKANRKIAKAKHKFESSLEKVKESANEEVQEALEEKTQAQNDRLQSEREAQAELEKARQVYMSQLEEAKRQYESDRITLEKEIKSKNQEIQARSTALDQRKTEITKMNQKISDLEAQNTAKQSEIQTLSTKIEASNLNTEMLKQQLNKESQTRAETAQNLESTKSLISELKGKLDGLKRSKETLAKSAGKFKEELESERKMKEQLESQFNDTQGALREAQGTLIGLQQEKSRAEKLAGKLKDQLQSEESRKSQLESQLNQKEGALAKLKGQFQGLAKERETLAGLADQMEGKLKSAEAEKAGLLGALKEGEAEKKGLESQLGKAKGKLAGLENKVAGLSDFKKKVEAQRRKKRDVARALKNAFKKEGMDIDVDPDTGEVTIPFTEVFFGFGSHTLKPEMKSVTKEVVRIFSQTIFSNTWIKKEVDSIELVGFASPIYKAKPFKPDVKSPEAVAALKYNMDLSYRRARSVFQYVFDIKKVQFQYQDQMLKITKVSGLSHIVSNLKERTPEERAIASQRERLEVCQIYRCEDWQKVNIKINYRGEKK